MTDERDKSSRGKESLARTTARDVPFARGNDSESDPAPRGQRPAQLPRDPTYEAELAQVELAVMRDPARRDDPSTKQGGGRRTHEHAYGQPPESITPESPGTRAAAAVTIDRAPEPPNSGRAVASGTLLSVGAVDPRGKTERTLETPRMFFSQPTEGAEAYFKPGKIPAVTVHQTLETETVKLSDSIDPRRAKTLPRIDRAALARLAELERDPESEAPVAMSQPEPSFDDPASAVSRPWNDHEYDPESSLGNPDRQIHASLSPFRDHGEPSFSLDGATTRPEPFAARRASDPPAAAPVSSDASAIPTQRDLPAHRIEASQPPPAPAPPSTPRVHAESTVPASEGTSPTTASIAVAAPEQRAPWMNYAAFVAALLLAVGLGLWLTSGSGSPQPSPDGAPSATGLAKLGEPPAPLLQPSAPAPVPTDAVITPLGSPNQAPTPRPEASAPRKQPAEARPKSLLVAPTPAAPPPSAPHKPGPPKPSRETIF
jgi:hypothetical protein